MTRYLKLLVAACLLTAAPAAQATTILQCVPIEELQSAADRGGHVVVFTGVENSGVSLIVFRNGAGEWAAAYVDANGLACIIGQGLSGRAPNNPAPSQRIPEEPA
ncbi:hypothetical protein K1W69_17420 [Hoeflea sp. WL0058]|uniref:Uncharacterized protein n=1 Tax=Flavimaribacter sediminis TaxID=2865987 RepID=A0AAE2ZQE8_9HYPH|nr:hypothetical protein [Flavimaribacter sediminis]MBW8638980.1 hypothetical protein [Flavimaribacter sediminis]